MEDVRFDWSVQQAILDGQLLNRRSMSIDHLKFHWHPR
jgi:hypothetical protein